MKMSEMYKKMRRGESGQINKMAMVERIKM